MSLVEPDTTPQADSVERNADDVAGIVHWLVHDISIALSDAEDLVAKLDEIKSRLVDLEERVDLERLDDHE